MAEEKRMIDGYVAEKSVLNARNIICSEITCDYDKGWADALAAVTDKIKRIPTVDDVEVVHGRWREKILVGGFAEEWGYVCSECGCTVSDRSNLGIGRYASKNQRLNYCPNCGAKMDGDGNA